MVPALVWEVGRVLLVVLVTIGWLLAAGVVVEAVTWVIWRVTGYRITLKFSPMYAEWNVINWQWSHGGRHGLTVHDPEDLREVPRALNHKGGSVMPWAFRFQWTRVAVVEPGRGRVFETAEARDAWIEANRQVVVHRDQEAA